MSGVVNVDGLVHPKHFVFNGGGSVGPLTLAIFAQKVQAAGLRLNNRVYHLIDPRRFGNGGIAYGHCAPKHKLNSVPGEMDPHSPGSFTSFLDERGLSFTADSFNARADYKPFLDQMVANSIATLKAHGAQIRWHESHGFVRAEGDGLYSIVDEDPTLAEANPSLVSPELTGLTEQDFLFTVGYGPNDNFRNLSSSPGFVQNLYSPDQIALSEREPLLQQRDGLRIAIIGAGPGAYDFINEFDGNPHTTELFIFSESGNEISARDVSLEASEISQPPNNLLALDKSASLSDVESTLRAEFNENARERSKRRIALDIMAQAKEILSRLELRVAQDFRKSVVFKRVCHWATPVPQESYDKMEAFAPTYIGEKLNGNITALQEGGFEIQTSNRKIQVDVVINATGHGRINSPVIKSMIHQGLAEIDPRTGLLLTDETGIYLEGSNIPVIGPATHFGLDGIETYAKYAEIFAQNMVDNISSSTIVRPYAKCVAA